MLQSPKSLTATIHVKFHYGELTANPVGESETELLNRILDQASQMDPSLQEILVNFVNYLNKLSEEGAEPGGDKH
ncbi:hypothetical protein ES703_112207 [subsurface metagenome]